MHRAARGGDSKAVIFFNIWERFVGAKLVESHMEALIAKKAILKHLHLEYRRTFERFIWIYMD